MSQIADDIQLQTDLTAPSFDPDKSRQYALYLYLTSHKLVAGILHEKQNSFLALWEYTFDRVAHNWHWADKLLTILEKQKWLQYPFQQTWLCTSSPWYTLVPAPLYRAGHSDELLVFNHHLPEDIVIKTDKLPTLDAYQPFALPQTLDRWSGKHLKKVEYRHASTALIETLLNQNEQSRTPHVYVQVQRNYLEVVVLENKKLRFYNAFAYDTPEDFIYYILFTFEQLELNPENAPLTFIGEITRDAKLFSLTYKYVRHIDFIKRPRNAQYDKVLDNLEPHFYYNLFSIRTCAS